MDKKQAIEKLERQLRLIDELKEKRYDHQDFTEWRRDTEVAIERIFGESSRHLKDFKDIRYRPSAYNYLNPDPDLSRAHIRGLEQTSGILSSIIREIDEYWDDQAFKRGENTAATTLIESLVRLISEGERLISQGTEIRNDYKEDLQPAYAAWQIQALSAIQEVGQPAEVILRGLEKDKQGPFFYPESATRVLGGLKAALAIVSRVSIVHGNDELPTPLIALAIIENLCKRFHRVAKQLESRREDRPTLIIKDEYDVQDLLHALLILHFDDVRKEERTPSRAGSSASMDFILKKEGIVVETKMARKGLRDKQVGDELIIDIKKYQKHPDCRILFCFIYDPVGFIANPRGLEDDLIDNSEEFQVKVLVAPSGL